jgi:Glycosyl hydrolases family 28
VARDQYANLNLISRRSFVKKAVLLTAGSACGCSIMGCSSELVIPCLGPAAAPVPVPGMTYIRASEIGCALDCSLENGRNKYTGGAATDDAPRINSALAGASANNPITLIIDGSALISGLFLPAGGYWSIAGLGCGTGFFVNTGTNNDGIHNGPSNAAIPFDPGPPAPARGMNVSLSNFTVNGNQGDGYNGDSTTGMRQGTSNVWYCGINLMNLDNITIEKVVVVNTPAYSIRLSNVGNVAISGCVMHNGPVFNTDGLHFDGPANDITISGCDFAMGDDSIALNCPEGYTGNISRVAVSNCTFNSFSLMRLYTMLSGPNFSIDTVSVNNCQGTFSEAAFNIGFVSNSSTRNSIASLTVSNCTLAAPAVLEVGENFGDMILSNVTLIVVPSSKLGCGLFRPSKYYSGPTYGSSLSINDCSIIRASSAVAAVILQNDSVIDNLTFNGLTVKNGGYSTPAEMLVLDKGSIEQLVLTFVDSINITAPVSAGGFSSVGSVSGAGVLATGWKFPDAVMANGVPYISGSSGSPSIKVGGVVEPYG